MRILVTGGAGFIGRQAVAAFLAKGHEVRVIDAALEDAHGPVPPAAPEGAETIWADLRDDGAAERAVAGVDLVCHQAALPGRGREIFDAAKYVGCNDLGTAALLAAMARAGTPRLVLASSVVVYGEGRYACPEHGEVTPAPRRDEDLRAGRFDPPCPSCGLPLAPVRVLEDAEAEPRNIYAVTKLAQEYLCRIWAHETGGSCVALRYHSVYGPDISYGSPYSGTVAAFRAALDRGEPPNVYEDGTQLRDYVHVRDVAAANVAAAGWQGTGFRAFNVASGDPRPLIDMARVLAAAAGGQEPYISGTYRLGDIRHIAASPERLMAELDWRPTVDFETGFKEFATARLRDVTPRAGG
ncbi:UDP-glucose 4-epimerase [Sphaerisporangium rufum]|uniref:UDP-glucose 4-epimerase n=1 Tax=Sphaerisporangium rufum TaxID=1381558 RepID=A0A919R7B2_9ACTN|nr:NAD-dependent epimerase/dehydratase family protein [Sphaerisporangium rufum]GII81006.1 UDP-glucose 4-epimerase [Sphaerisporangium rufum]